MSLEQTEQFIICACFKISFQKCLFKQAMCSHGKQQTKMWKEWWNIRSAFTNTELKWYMDITYFTLGLFGKLCCLLALVSFSILLSINHQNRTSPTESLTALWALHTKHQSLARLQASSVPLWHLPLLQQSPILLLLLLRDILLLPATMPSSA